MADNELQHTDKEIKFLIELLELCKKYKLFLDWDLRYDVPVLVELTDSKENQIHSAFSVKWSNY